MKKEKFMIEVYGYECELISMHITKKEFETKLKHLKNEVEKTKNNECPIDMVKGTTDKDTFTITTYVFDVSTTEIILYHFKCKDGYCFK